MKKNPRISDWTGAGFLAGPGLRICPGRGKFCMNILTLRQYFHCFAHGVDNEQVCFVFHPQQQYGMQEFSVLLM